MPNSVRFTFSRTYSASSLSSSLCRRLLPTAARRCVSYGFIGLGKMGYPMAQNLRKRLPAEDTLVVYDINKAATEQFSAESRLDVQVAADVNEVVQYSETIVTMLPEPAHVSSVFSNLAKSPPALKSNKKRLFIDSSTIDITTSLNISRLVSDTPTLNGTFVDAPVSGGVLGASAGTLTFLLGCPESLIGRINPILSKMGSRILRCGDSGSGLAAKIANNYLLAISNIGVSEAMNLGLKLGLNNDVLKSVINSSSGKCWSSEVNNPIDNELRGFEGGFGVALMKKDLGLAVQAAESSGAKLVLAKKAEQVYADVLEKEGSKDFSVVFKWLKDAKNK